MIMNKRRKPIKKPGNITPVRKPRNHAIRMNKEAIAQEQFDRNIKKEREIGVHPKFWNRQSDAQRYVKVYEADEKQWEERN